MVLAPAAPRIKSDPPFAQEIVDNIIDCLRGDKLTLKRCTMVSRSFRAPSRRNLFFSINLNSPQETVRFYHLLSSAPDFACHVRRLAVVYHFESMYTVASHPSHTLLANILEQLPNLSELLWDNYRASWKNLSSDLRSALVKQFQSPSLTNVVICLLDDFPLVTLHNVSAVKRLQLYCSPSMDSVELQQIVLPHLEALLIGSDVVWSTKTKLIVPNLRQLSFASGPVKESLALVQHAINTSAGSLERIRWEYMCHHSQPYRIDFSELHRLRFLTLIVHYGPVMDEFPLMDILTDLSATHCLEEVKVGIVFHVYSEWRETEIHGSKTWGDLDSVVAAIPTLRQVTVAVKVFSTTELHIPIYRWAVIRAAMPLLAEKGVLILTSCSPYTSERDVWSVVTDCE